MAMVSVYVNANARCASLLISCNCVLVGKARDRSVTISQTFACRANVSIFYYLLDRNHIVFEPKRAVGII